MGEGLKMARAAAKATRTEKSPPKGECPRCSGDHAGRGCKAPFVKSWPGRPAMKILLRFPDGMTLDMISALTQDQFERVNAVCLEAWKGEPEAPAVPS